VERTGGGRLHTSREKKEGVKKEKRRAKIKRENILVKKKKKEFLGEPRKRKRGNWGRSAKWGAWGGKVRWEVKLGGTHAKTLQGRKRKEGGKNCINSWRLGTK